MGAIQAQRTGSIVNPATHAKLNMPLRQARIHPNRNSPVFHTLQRSRSMRKQQLKLNRSSRSRPPERAVHPDLEGLEDRLLLYADLGDQWTYSSRITYSFMPDGTSVGGVPSALFQTLNAKYATATWENQIQQAAALWEN